MLQLARIVRAQVMRALGASTHAWLAQWGLCLVLLVLVGCKSGDKVDHKPTGSPTDPVDVCERPAQVCQYKGSQLGVCIARQKTDPSCQGKSPCFVCVPQH